MKTPPKSFWFILIILFLVVIAVTIMLPGRTPDSSDINLIFLNDSDLSVGSVYVSYARWDGSNVTEGGMNADNSLLKRGDALQFDDIRWPVVVMVCSDQQGREVLAQVVVEEAPAEGGLWCVTLVDGTDGPNLVVEDVPKG